MAGEVILVVDDGRETRDFVIDYILRPNGYQALVAKDGKEGLEKAISHQPDLILLDVQMPKMDGIQVLEIMKERKIDIPVILMTFHGSEEIAIKVFRLGVRDYVMKPFTVDEISEAIEVALSAVRLRREKEALTERLLASNRDLQRRLRELNALYSIGKSVTQLLEIEKLFVRIVEAAVYVTGAEEGVLMLLEDRALWRRALKGRGEAVGKLVRAKVTARIAYRALQTG